MYYRLARVLLLLGVLFVPFSLIHPQDGGLVLTSEEVTDGYVLFAPSRKTTTYLINNAGEVVHTWQSRYITGHSVYLLPNGNLLRAGAYPTNVFRAGGSGGIIEEFDWNGNLVWSYTIATPRRHAHHDYEVLPNGNMLIIVWEAYTYEESIAAGRRPDLMPNMDDGDSSDSTIWADIIIELNPRTKQIVWEWRTWDHLIQNHDPNLPNYGNPIENPGRIDINFTGGRLNADWTHLNSIDYDPELGHIMVSTPFLGETWIINHNTTTEEARGPAGDLLYRWGNRQAYGAPGGQSLFSAHDPEWLPNGNVLVFNNGVGRGYSSVDEWVLPVQPDGTYRRGGDGTFEDPALVWQYTGGESFYADRVSSGQRLPNGNTLIAEGPEGRIFEISPDMRIVWEYISPFVTENNRQIFRADRYLPDHPAFAGKNLVPINP